MFSYRPVFRQHQSPLPKTQSLISGQLPSVSLLQRCGVDARSLAEIKRRRIGYTSSIYFGVATTQMPAYLQKGLDMIVSNSIILTAHSSQLTAHSSQLTAHSSSVRTYYSLHSNPLHTARGLTAANTSSCAYYISHIPITAAQCNSFLNIIVYVPQPVTEGTAHTAALSLPHLTVKKPP